MEEERDEWALREQGGQLRWRRLGCWDHVADGGFLGEGRWGR